MIPAGQPVVYHIPACPFSQQPGILLAPRSRRDAVRVEEIDIAEPRPAWLLQDIAA